MALILALDQGTSSSRSIVFDEQGHILASAQLETRQHYPHPGWVEHDPMELWTSQRDTAHAALVQLRTQGRDLSEVYAVGITNQRETTVLWRRDTGQPVGPAIVWQDRRTEAQCARWREQGLADLIRAKTGLVIDPYFSGSKLQWLLDHIDGARAAAQRGELAFGTVDSWLLWNLTGGTVHATDVSNASRTMLFNIHTQDWDDELLGLMDIPREVLPKVHPSSHVYGEAQPGIWGSGDFLAGLGALPIGGIAGDQQAATIGQGCLAPGQTKATYGTGAFVLTCQGSRIPRSTNRLLGTVLTQLDGARTYAIEGSVFVAGSLIKWLRDSLGIIGNAAETEALARSIPHSGGVTIVPALSGLGAPHWQADARGVIERDALMFPADDRRKARSMRA